MRAGLLAICALMLCSCSMGSSSEEKPTAGVVQGGMVRENVSNREDAILQQEEILRRQQAQMEKQQREIEDLKRQQLRNQSLKRYGK